MAYVLGFFAADGYITVNRRGGQYWCIQIKDKELLENIKKVVSSEHKISIRIIKKPAKSILYRIQIGSVEMCNDLRKLGYSERKTKSLAIPNIPDEYFPNFVRGYFDGDGNVWTGLINKKRITPNYIITTCFTSCSFCFLYKLKKKFEHIGIECGKLYKLKDKQCHRLKLNLQGSLKLYDFMYNRGDQGLSGLFLERKKRIFEIFIRLRP